MTTALTDSAKMEHILRGRNGRPKYYILPQHSEEGANVAFWEDPLNLCDALRSEDESKWEAAMQEEYNLLLTNKT